MMYKQDLKNLSEYQTDILKTLFTIKEEGMERDELCEKAKIPRSTAYNNLYKLIKMRLVTSFDEDREGMAGRPKIFYKLTKKGNTIMEDYNE